MREFFGLWAWQGTRCVPQRWLSRLPRPNVQGFSMDKNLLSHRPARFAKTRLNEAEYQAFVAVLLELGTTRSRMLRKMIRELIRWGPDLLSDELKLFREAVYQVGAIGRNLNQLVKAIHNGKQEANAAVGSTLNQVKDQVNHLEKVLLEVVK